MAPKVAAKAKGRARLGRRRPARRGDEPSLPLPEPKEWTPIEEWKPELFPLATNIVAKVWYGGEEGQVQGLLQDETRDLEGHWMGIKLKGTTLAQLRNWGLTHGSQSLLYLSQKVVPAPERRQLEGLGYLLAIRKVTEADQEAWMNNCCQDERAPEETRDLLRAAQALKNQGRIPPGPDLQGGALEAPEEADPPPKKLSAKQKVKKMIEKAKWSPSGTPLDPGYRRPIKLKVKRQKSSSGSTSRSSSSSRSSAVGLGEEHRLRSLSRRLPGHLARQSAKEAIKLLASQSGEHLTNYQVFSRYYRQVIQGRGGSRGLQRELLTLSSVVDVLLSGEILCALDILCQRIKGLELLQQGAEPTLALQVELIPREQLGLTQDVEGRFAQREFKNETKLLRDLKATPMYGGKGSWTGPNRDQGQGGQTKGKKGKNWEKGKSKGGPPKKSGERPVVAPGPPA